MKHSTKRQSFFGIMILALLLAMAIPATALGQGHGRGHGKGNGNFGWSNYNKKCAKFRNCHDASEGRWDGRGPRGYRVSNTVWRNRYRRNETNFRYRRYPTYNTSLWRIRHR